MILRIGSNGSAVAQLQLTLNQLAHAGQVKLPKGELRGTGTFGEKTKATVKALQAERLTLFSPETANFKVGMKPPQFSRSSSGSGTQSAILGRIIYQTWKQLSVTSVGLHCTRKAGAICETLSGAVTAAKSRPGCSRKVDPCSPSGFVIRIQEIFFRTPPSILRKRYVSMNMSLHSKSSAFGLQSCLPTPALLRRNLSSR